MSFETADLQQLVITLSDVAVLARVQRPVVTMWRNRRSLAAAPFPPPVRVDRGQEHFDGAAVVAWLETTGRGRNPDAREDLAAFASLAGASAQGDAVIFAGLTALLCIRATTGEPLGALRRAGLLDLADELDPTDDHLVAELELLGDRVVDLARYADLLADAAYNPVAAFESLMRGRFRLHVPGHARTALAEPARELVARIAEALAIETPQPPVLVDPTAGGSDLLMAALTRPAGAAAGTATPDDPRPEARLVRRRLRTHDVHRISLRAGATLSALGPATVLAGFPAPGTPAMSDGEILTALQNIAGSLGPNQRGVVVAPARVLVDRLADREDDRLRSDLLRSGRVRVVVGLSPGQVVTKPRQPLGLWLLGPSPPDVEPADRLLLLADLRDTALTDPVVEDLVSDVVAALGDRSIVQAHAFRFGRPALVRALLTARRGLLGVDVPAVRDIRRRTPEVMLEVTALFDRLAQSSILAPLPDVTLRPAIGSGPVATTLGALLDKRGVRVVPGNRLDPATVSLATDGTGAPIVGPDELTGAATIGGRRVGALPLAAAVPTARYTEPGDIVFCTSPRPAAIVDVEGASVVAFPARVLRIDRSAAPGLLPDVLAADINAQGTQARAWRSWRVRLVPPTEAELLQTVLTDLHRQREATIGRLADLDALTGSLITATSGGELSLCRHSDAVAPNTRFQEGS